MDEEKLITLVEQNKCLWASSHKEYKNQYMRQQAWKSIAAVLNSTENEVKKRWRSLRDTYSRKLNDMNQPSGSGYKHVGWKYFQVMSFLKDCYASRPREGNVPIRKDPVNEEYLEYDYNNNEVEHLDEDESYSIFDSESSRTATNSPAPSKKKKTNAGSVARGAS
ncbi:uncharacterized protein LOC120899584 [Anopheles arabiensis]|uniref:uncharacterized protein LOC120899584 n=1 Tax=Anopheles arabiensis TaxID=7173 RepID=UPI001AAD1A14|nr:uncharacterized protein LOC120899584 [Anopheles arabiensis]